MSRHDHHYIAKLDIQQLAAGLYEYQVTFAGQAMYSAAGFTSISDAIEAAADVTGGIQGFELSYRGLVVGTYPLEVLSATAETVASRAIETVAAFCDE